jgi:T4 RnlA family RNA ligase|tara:strand:- start:9414 stop:10499 length:1086 start_codon:yes stop_codon:yes gene_type:complete
MKIFNINLDFEMFSFKDGIIGGDKCILLNPNNIKCKWVEDTLRFRSMIVRKSDHKIVSRGFDKFFNYPEQPDLDKFPDGCFTAVEKKDGSLIIWGVHNDELIHRTRGTFNAEGMDNGHEIQFLKDKYPEFIKGIYNHQKYSILTEWQTRTNIIVISEVAEPTLTLVGIVENDTGALLPQETLDLLALAWKLDRPKYHEFESIDQCIRDVDLWVGSEGVVLYSEDGQKLRKIKSEWYRALHSICTGIKSIKHVLDVFMASPKFIEETKFFTYIEETIDHEVAVKNEDYIGQVTEAYGKVVHTRTIIDLEIERYISKYDTRKEQALSITTQWSGWMIPYAFQKLDDKVIDDKIIRIAIESYID